MKRVLEHTRLVSAPFNGEGDDFWGNTPPFSPTAEPAGVVYQRQGGERGHEIDEADATPAVRALLQQRLEALAMGPAPYFVNKNPYNCVRVPWIRALFPDAVIVALVRDPVANVYSLLKKHELGRRGATPPEEGWWGVKPRGWREHATQELVARCAWQWSAANEKLATSRADIDHVVSYRELCANPRGVAERVLGRPIGVEIESIRCFDDEFSHGSELRSKNRYVGKLSGFAEPSDEIVEFDALAGADVATIEGICRPTKQLFAELH